MRPKVEDPAAPPAARPPRRGRSACRARPRCRPRRARRTRRAPRAVQFSLGAPAAPGSAWPTRCRRRCRRRHRRRAGRGPGSARGACAGVAPAAGCCARGSRPAAAVRGGRSTGGCRRAREAEHAREGVRLENGTHGVRRHPEPVRRRPARALEIERRQRALRADPFEHALGYIGVLGDDPRRVPAQRPPKPREFGRRDEGEPLVEGLEDLAAFEEEVAPRRVVVGHPCVQHEVVAAPGDRQGVELDRAKPAEDVEYRIGSSLERASRCERVACDEKATCGLSRDAHGWETRVHRSGVRQSPDIDGERGLWRVGLGSGCRVALQVLDSDLFRREHRMEPNRTRARVTGSVGGSCGDEDDGARVDLARVLVQGDFGTALEDHDQLVDRMRVERNAIARSDLFDDQRDVVDVRPGADARDRRAAPTASSAGSRPDRSRRRACTRTS